MKGKSNIFFKLDDLMRIKVQFGDENEVNVMGKCTLAFNTNQGETTHIHNNFFMPKLQHTLLSIG